MPRQLSLLQTIEAFLKKHQMPATTFGLAAINDGKFVGSLRRGRRCWPETEAKVREFMRTYRPPRFQFVTTAGGTTIAFDPVTGRTATGRDRTEAEQELQRLLTPVQEKAEAAAA